MLVSNISRLDFLSRELLCLTKMSRDTSLVYTATERQGSQPQLITIYTQIYRVIRRPQYYTTDQYMHN